MVPAESAGTIDVTVVTAGGTSTTGSADHFTFVAAPVVSGISPTVGPLAGGTTVTISGSHFTGASAVGFGTTPAASFTVVSDTSISATSPAMAAGTVDITVATAGGWSATSSADQFTFADPQEFAGVAITPTADVTPLTFEELQPVLAEAIHRWATVSGDATTADRLRKAQIHLVDLPDNVLGLEADNSIWIDLTAAGHGWFVDTNPADDAEFPQMVTARELHAAAGSAAAGRVDLLTVLEHELAHVLGLADESGTELLATFLPLGARRLPGANVLLPTATVAPPPAALIAAPPPVRGTPEEPLTKALAAVLGSPVAGNGLPVAVVATSVPVLTAPIPSSEGSPVRVSLLAPASQTSSALVAPSVSAAGAPSVTTAYLRAVKSEPLDWLASSVAVPLNVASAPLVPVVADSGDGVPTTATVGGASEVLLGGEGDTLILGEQGASVLVGGFGPNALAG
jgi:hypothetical protein